MTSHYINSEVKYIKTFETWLEEVNNLYPGNSYTMDEERFAKAAYNAVLEQLLGCDGHSGIFEDSNK